MSGLCPEVRRHLITSIPANSQLPLNSPASAHHGATGLCGNPYLLYPDVSRVGREQEFELYLFSFRNHGAFHEIANIIMKDLIHLMNRGI